MPSYQIMLPSKPKVVLEEGNKGVFEIEGLYTGYGHTLGNSLRRIILSSLPGASITSLKIDGVSHEFSNLEGVKEDVIMIILNLKKVRFKMITDEPQTAFLSIKGPKEVYSKDIKTSGQVEVLSDDVYLFSVTDKVEINIELKIEKGLGFVQKEILQKEKVEIGVINVDAIFTPIRRVSYDVENMRVGDKTNFNKLIISIETDGTLSPKEALTSAILIMIDQLKAIVGFKEDFIEEEISTKKKKEETKKEIEEKSSKDDEITDVLKTRTEELDLSTRTLNALSQANVRTLGGLARKKREDLLEIEGIGEKGISEIKKVLEKNGLSLKD